MTKPNLITTRKPLPFDELSPLEFERMCLWLVEKEGYLNIQHLGETGSEKGRDIVAYKPTNDGDELWYFQCKRHRRITSPNLKAEIKKYIELSLSDPSKSPVGVIFITSAPVSSQIREETGAFCGAQGYQCEFWARTELDMLVKKYPEIVEEFFYVSPPSYPPALHQLPSPPKDFTGRERELEDLREAFKQGTTIFGIYGLGGIGKTVTALKLARELSDSYPHGQFFLDLKGASKAPLLTAEAMGHIIRSYHPLSRLPETKDGLTALYRSVLHNQRAILLFDNVLNRDQVMDLIPPEGCLMILTARQHFVLDGLYVKSLANLESDDARNLQLKIAPRIGEHADEINKLCGGLPLALRVAASTIAVHKDLRVEDYLQRLKNESQRFQLLDEVQASLKLSYELLQPVQQELWRFTSVFPGRFHALAVEATWGWSEETAQNALSTLVNYSLLEWDAGTSCYRMHDLVRVFARSCLSEAEAKDFYWRHSQYYAEIVQFTNVHFLKGGESLKQGLALLDAEWTNIEAGHDWAVQNAETDIRALKLCDLYQSWGFQILPLRLNLHQRLAWLEMALTATEKLGPKQAQGWHLGNMGLAYEGLGQTHRAVSVYEHRLTLAREISDQRGEAITLVNLANAYTRLGEVPRSMELAKASLVISRDTAARDIEGAALSTLAEGYLTLGQTMQSLQFTEQALLIHQETGDRRAEAAALGDLGRAYMGLDVVDGAFELFEQALAIALEIGDKDTEGKAWGDLGRIYAAIDEPQIAVENYQRYLTIAREFGDRVGEAGALSNIGLALRDLGNLDEAIECQREALKILLRTGDRMAHARTLWNLAITFYDLSNYPDAVNYGQKALKIFGDVGSPLAVMARKAMTEWRTAAGQSTD